MLTAQAWCPGDDCLTPLGEGRTVNEMLGRAERQGFRAVSITSPRYRMIYRRLGPDWVLTYNAWS